MDNEKYLTKNRLGDVMNLKKVCILLLMSSFILNYSIPAYAIQKVTISNDRVKISDVPNINQFPELPTGCEATALTILLKYYEVNVTKQEVANRLPKEALSYYKDQVKYGGDPNKGFVGNPYSKSSYGVFEKPILQVLNEYLPNRADDLTGKTLGEILEYVKQGRPVMIWVTINMHNIVYRQSWKLETGELFKWPGNEHAVVITGYDANYIYLNDPYTGNERKYERQMVENRYNALGKRAVAISEDSTEISFKVVSNGIVKYEAFDYKAIQQKDRILLPARYLSSIDSRITLEYREGKVYLNIEGEQLELDKKYNEVNLFLQDKKISTLYYEIKNDITLIELEGLKEILPITYEIQENELMIEIDPYIEINI